MRTAAVVLGATILAGLFGLPTGSWSVPTSWAQPATPNRQAQSAAQSGKPTRSNATHPKLDSHLAEVAAVERAGGAAAAAQKARERAIDTKDSKLRVVIESADRDPADAKRAIRALGGEVQAEYKHLVQALVPANALVPLAQRSDVRFVRPPLHAEPDAVKGQGVGATAANSWHSAGWKGAGVKIGVIDLGFFGYQARQAGRDLPSSAITANFCGDDPDDFIAGGDHGTAVAEIVHEMAPQAQLYLICVGTEVQLGQALDYAKAQGIQIVNHSVTWFNSSRGDGSGEPGTPNAIVADARQNGILWVNSAGNRAQLHWSGTFAGGPDWHVWGTTSSGNDIGNSLTLGPGQFLGAFLKWDDWPASDQDYDLLLVDGDPASCNPNDCPILDWSTNVQDGTQKPRENIFYFNDTGAPQRVSLLILRLEATEAPRFDLFISGGPPPQYRTPEGSVTEPGSSPHALAAGAICWKNNALEPFSSRGPTIDGRIKPDIAGQDSVSTAAFGPFDGCGDSGFPGTSAAAPHVAGAAALVKGANPDFGPDELQAFLEEQAQNLGPPGKDNSFGAGKLSLGSPPRPPGSDNFAGTQVPNSLPRQFTADTAFASVQNGELTDVCAGATAIRSTRSQRGGNVGPAAVSIGKTIWYRYKPTTATELTVSTAGSDFDTVIAVYHGTRLDALTPVDGACNNDDGSSPQARVTFNTLPGTTYFIQVGGLEGASGEAVVNFSGRRLEADLAVTNTDALDPVQVGQDLTHQINVSNNGPDPAAAARLTFTFPGSLTFGSATPSQGSCTRKNTTLTCDLGALASGASATVEIHTTPTKPNRITTRAKVSSALRDPVASNNSASQVTTAQR